MTPYEQAVHAGKELAQSTEEILINLKAVRGDTFSVAVAAAFEVLQLVDMLARISYEAKDNEYVVGLAAAANQLASSIAAKTAVSLSDAEVNEVLDMAEKLNERRMKLTPGARKAG